MAEADLIAAIVKLCDEADPPVRWVHLAAVKYERCPWVRGLPDLFLVGTKASMWREIKFGSTRITSAQDSWLDALEQAGADADLWDERDLQDGSVAREITGLNG